MSMLTDTKTDTRHIYSSLGADPDLGELVKQFVAEMPDRMTRLFSEYQRADWEQLGRTAQQLKRAAGSYGFHALTPLAAQLEVAVRGGQPEQHIRRCLDELAQLCRQIRAGAPT